MPISPVTPGFSSFAVSEARLSSVASSRSSTLTTLQEFGGTKKPSPLSWVIQKLRAFWNWFISWIPKKTPTNDSLYFKIEDGQDGVNKYRLILGGKRTENIVKMGLRTVYLNELSFPDKEALTKLPLMLEQIMDKEGIDVIQTRSFPIAYHLWQGGFKTESSWSMAIPVTSPLGHVFKDLICRAMEERHTLNDAGLFALETIEERLVMAVVSDAFMQEAHLETFFQKSISVLEEIFPASHLRDASKRLLQKTEFETTRAMIEFFHEQIPYAIHHHLETDSSLDLRVDHLFALADSMGVSLERGLAVHLDHTMIFKKEKT